MSEEQTVKLRVTADTSGLSTAAADAKAQIASIGESAQSAAAKTRESLQQAQTKMDSFARTGGNVAQELGNQQDQLAKKFQQTASEGSRMGLVIGTAIAGVAVAFTVLISKQIEYAASLDVTARRIGASTEELSSLGAAARRNDADFAAVVSGLDALAQVAGRAAAGAGQGSKLASAAFQALGVSVTDAQGHLRPMTALLEDVARGLSQLPAGALKTRLETQLLGQAGRELEATLGDLAHGGMQGLIDKATETGQVISTKAAAEAHKFKDNLNALQDDVVSFGQSVAQDLLPTLTALAGVFRDNVSAAHDAGNETSTLRGFVEGLGLAVVVTKETLRVLFTMLFAGIDVLGGAGDVINGVIGDLTHIGRSIIAANTFDMRGAQAEFDAAGAALAAGWEKGAKRAATAWSVLKDVGTDAQAKIDAYNLRVAQGHDINRNGGGQFTNVVAGSGAVATNDATAQAKAEAAALKALQDAFDTTAKSHDKAAAAALELANAWKTGENMLSGLEGSLNATAKAQADFDIGTRNIEAAMQGIAIAGGDVDAVIVLWQKLDAALAAQLAKTNAEIIARGKLATGNASIATQLQQQRDKLLGLTAATLAYDQALVQATTDQQADIAAGMSAEIVAANMAKRLRDIAKLRDDMEANDLINQFGSKSEYDQLVENLGRVEDAMKKAFDKDQLAGLQRAQEHIKNGMEEINMSLLGQGISSLQKFAKEGTAAYTALGIAQDILAYRSAIAAIANQGGGDPYTAFARIAAMIALMASIGIRVSGGGSGPSAQSAEVRQAEQGTGSVLGDTAAKSESIAHAVEITAHASEQLVGLNRSMLTALLALQAGLGAAGNQLARGAGEAPLPQLTGGIDIPGDPLMSGILGLLFGGKQKIIDQGIVIAGGTLSDMLDKIVIGAYSTVHTSGGLFGGGGDSENVTDISDKFGKQFQLVIKSIADTVRAGALALGLLPADVEAAIAAFKVEEIKISLKGLSADDQQKALEAVFSKLFDGLAGAVVPFIGQFQKVGEGLGETLIRVATEVQVTQEAFKQLGFSVNELDPEKFAQISDALVVAAGGLDSFISGLQSFVANFAPEQHKFQVESDALTSALDQVGLSVPATRDGMWELMQSLDATTESGRAQIATLLRLADVSNQYYTDLDKYYTDLEKSAQKQVDYASFIAGLNAEGAGLSTVSPFAAARLAIEKWEQDSIKQANALAKAAGLQGAAEQDLTLIHSIAAHKIADAIAALVDASRSLVDKLYGTGAATKDAANTASSAIGNFGAAMTSAAQAATNAINLLLGSLSPLNDQQKLATAMAGLRAGTVSQEAVLEIGRRLFASSQAYNTLFAQVQGYPGLRQGGGASGVFNAAASVTSTPVLTADEIARQRHGDADQLAQNIASLANAEGKTYAEVAAELHLNLGNLAADLNLSQAELTTYFDQLVAQENAVPDSIGVSADRIVAALYDIARRPPPGGPQIPDGHHTRIPGQYADVTVTPGPDDNANAGDHGGAGNSSDPGGRVVYNPRSLSDSTASIIPTRDTALSDRLDKVNERLDKILAATRDGSGHVVAAVHDGTDAMRDVDRALQRGADQSGINGRRNDREYVPR